MSPSTFLISRMPWKRSRPRGRALYLRKSRSAPADIYMCSSILPTPAACCWNWCRTCQKEFEVGCGFRRPHLTSSDHGVFQKIIHQLTRRIVHLDIERFDLAGEVVEHHYGGNGDGQTQGCGYQRLRNAASDCADAGGLLALNLAEGVDDADHRAQQADERCGRADSCQSAQAPLKFGVGYGRSAIQRP